MKLIQIFALATVMATAAVAQTTGQGNPTGPQQSSPSATPKPPAKATSAHAKSGAGKTPPAAAAGSAKTSSPTAPASTKSAATDKKPAVQTGVLPQKKKKNGAPSAASTTHTAGNAAKTGAPAGPAAPAAKTTSTVKSAAPAKSATGANGASKKSVAHGAAGAAHPKVPGKAAATAASPNPKNKTRGAAEHRAPETKAAATAPATTPEKKAPPRLIGSAGRRDPFVSPIRNAGAVSPSQACTSGKRCLNIPELVLQGTVRDISGRMMAVVSTANHTRTYTLRENDQVFNGSVEKITSDSIIFREYVKDPLGRESAKEVVKKMGPTS